MACESCGFRAKYDKNSESGLLRNYEESEALSRRTDAEDDTGKGR